MKNESCSFKKEKENTNSNMNVMYKIENWVHMPKSDYVPEHSFVKYKNYIIIYN